MNRHAQLAYENRELRAEVERLREVMARAIIELRGTTAQGGDAEALLTQALAMSRNEVQP